MFGTASREKAYFAPFFVFLALLGLREIVAKTVEGRIAPWYLSASDYWVYPLQTIVCGFLLWQWRGCYELRRPAKPGFTILIGVLVLAIWVAPQALFHAAPRMDGFDPNHFGTAAAYWVNIAFRFARLVIVVPLVEEIFWRGFLLRYLVNEDFTKVPFGTFTWRSFLLVTAGFCFEHSMPDWPAAIAAGMLYNLVAYRTRSLMDCVLAHAITNLLLGFYVLKTGQLGFW